MESTGRSLPTGWEERWRTEKERRRKVAEEGGEEKYEQELKRIVAYNDSRMGSEVKAGKMREGGRGEIQSAEERDDHRVHVCCSEFNPREIFAMFKEFLDSQILTDLTLVTATGTQFPVHSVILAAVSKLVLERLKGKNMASSEEAQRGRTSTWVVHLPPEVDDTGVAAVVDFSYTGGVTALGPDTVVEMEVAAEVFGMERMTELCNKERRGAGSPVRDERRTSEREQMMETLQAVEELRADDVACDVTLDVEDTFIHVHRVVLAANSDYFRGMFTSGMKESHQACVALPFLSALDLESLIKFSYSGSLLLSWDSVFEVACTALQLQFQHAVSLCLNFMQQKLQFNSCLDVASFAEAYGMSDLLQEADDFVLRNFREVSTTEKFQDLPAAKLLEFVQHDGLCVPSELAVFRAVITWIQADPEARLVHSSSLMRGVRFPLMTFREFREVRAISLQLESFGDTEVELYGTALKEFGFGLPQSHELCRVRHPKDVLVLVGGDQLNLDAGQREPSRELWFANSLRSGTGLIKGMEWRRLGDIPDKPRFRHGVAVLNGMMYVAGGCYFYATDDMMKSAYSYDPLKESWNRLADMHHLRSNFSLVALGERLYAIGGDKTINANMDSIEEYNPGDGSWRLVRPLDCPLSGYAATVFNGGIFVSGGFDCKYVCLASVFLYHPETGTTYLADMANDRAQHCMAATGGHLYVAGGVCNLRRFYSNQRACEAYDPVTDTWTAIPPLPVPHVGAASAVLEEKIYILGGYCQEDYSESGLVHRFDPSMQRWENMGKLPGAATDVRACVLRLPEHVRG